MVETGAEVTELWWIVHGWALSLEEAEHIAEHGLDQHWGELRGAVAAPQVVQCMLRS
jgi:hypothetical protein